MQIVAYPEAEVLLELRLQVVSLQAQEWPSDQPSGPSAWHDPALRPLSMLLIDEGRVLAALDVLSKNLVHGGRSYSASGLSTVVTDPTFRGVGHGLRIVDAARQRIAEDGADLGIFTCDRHLQGFYEGAGWQCLPGSVLIGGTREAPFPSDRFDKVTMAAFFSLRARDRAASFVGSRIELFPGEVDRLW